MATTCRQSAWQNARRLSGLKRTFQDSPEFGILLLLYLGGVEDDEQAGGPMGRPGGNGAGGEEGKRQPEIVGARWQQHEWTKLLQSSLRKESRAVTKSEHQSCHTAFLFNNPIKVNRCLAWTTNKQAAQILLLISCCCHAHDSSPAWKISVER